MTYCIIILASVFLVACGKKGGVEPLEPSDYPHTYPKPTTHTHPETTSLEKPHREDFYEAPGCCE